jgi:hypothetical protein
MMWSAMNYIYVSIASSKHWLISSRSGELSIFSARMARISPIISVWSQMMFVSVTSGSIVGLFRDGGRQEAILGSFLGGCHGTGPELRCRTVILTMRMIEPA